MAGFVLKVTLRDVLGLVVVGLAAWSQWQATGDRQRVAELEKQLVLERGSVRFWIVPRPVTCNAHEFVWSCPQGLSQLERELNDVRSFSAGRR